MVSLGATTYDLTLWKLSPIGLHLFRVLCDESPLEPMDITSPVTSLSISHLQLYSQYYSYDPSPMSQFHFLPGLPCRYNLSKGIMSPPYSIVPISPCIV